MGNHSACETEPAAMRQKYILGCLSVRARTCSTSSHGAEIVTPAIGLPLSDLVLRKKMSYARNTWADGRIDRK